ncbi:MAG: hypothetical protein HY908_21650 [Myxococcales bacterium]|nr:hypothetical protein [Myxococcales bacterium]
MRRRVILVGAAAIAAAACARAPEVPRATASAATVTASATAAPPPPTARAAPPTAPTAPTAPATPATADGTSRLAFELPVRGREGVTVRATLDVPAGMGIALDEEETILTPCRAARAAFGPGADFTRQLRSLALRGRACHASETTAEACIRRQLGGSDGIEWLRPGVGRLVDTTSRGGDRIAGTVVLYDPAAQATVSCEYTLLGGTMGSPFEPDGRPLADVYAPVCASLSLAAAGSPAATARAPALVAGELPAPKPEHARAVEVARAFVAAAARHDVAAMKKEVLSPADCTAVAAVAKKKSDCPKDTGAMQAEVGRFLAQAPPVAASDAPITVRELDPNLLVVEVPVAGPCGVFYPMFVVHLADRDRVVFMMAKRQ